MSGDGPDASLDQRYASKPDVTDLTKLTLAEAREGLPQKQFSPPS